MTIAALRRKPLPVLAAVLGLAMLAGCGPDRDTQMAERLAAAHAAAERAERAASKAETAADDAAKPEPTAAFADEEEEESIIVEEDVEPDMGEFTE
ncbi:MAG TPA: hypothetical protein PKD92_10045 [Novosphingobium sp.]|nr:hypothetical protein [Novosphingobium sp.]